MSAIIMLEVKTDKTPEEIHNQVKIIWNSSEWRRVDVSPHPERSTLLCKLRYYFYSAEEEVMVRDVIDWLFSVSLDGKLYYYRNAYAFFWEDYKRTISVNDIFTQKRYRPGEHNGRQFRYILKKPKAGRTSCKIRRCRVDVSNSATTVARLFKGKRSSVSPQQSA